MKILTKKAEKEMMDIFHKKLIMMGQIVNERQQTEWKDKSYGGTFKNRRNYIVRIAGDLMAADNVIL